MSKQGKATTITTPPAKQNVLDQADAIAEALGQTDTAPATPPAPTATAPTPTVATPTPESELPKAGETEVSDSEALVNQVADPALRAKLLEQIKKLEAHASTSLAQEAAKQKAKAWTEFDNDLKAKLSSLFDELAKKHSVKLVNRRVVITFPEGKPKYSNAPSSGNGTGTTRTGKGFQNGGKVELDMGNGAIQHYTSRHDAAKSLGLQYEGRRDATQVFTEPLELGTKKALGYKFSVEKVENVFHITKIAS
jgi:hypothetical protein